MGFRLTAPFLFCECFMAVPLTEGAVNAASGFALLVPCLQSICLSQNASLRMSPSTFWPSSFFTNRPHFTRLARRETSPLVGTCTTRQGRLPEYALAAADGSTLHIGSENAGPPNPYYGTVMVHALPAGETATSVPASFCLSIHLPPVCIW